MTNVSGNEGNNSYTDFYRQFQSYLKTRIELSSSEFTQKETGQQQAVTKVKIMVINTAPEELDWPKIVFIGVGLSIAYLGEHISNISPHQLIIREVQPDKTPRVGEQPWQQDDKFKRLSQIGYNRIAGQDFPDSTSGEGVQGKMLFPGQSVIFEMDVLPETIPYIQFRVDGTVSRRHLFHYQETLVMPETFTKPLATAALRAFNDIDIHKALDSVIASMPDFNSDTRLAEVQAFAAALTSGMTEIKATQEAVVNAFRQHKMFWFQAHLRSAYICLDRVSAALVRMREAIASSTPDKIAAEASAIRALKGEAAQLNRATEDLMHKQNISEEEEEVRKSKVSELKAVIETATQFKTESPVPVIRNIPDELDLHGKTVEEAIPLVDKFLEDSYNANKRRVWIVHGKGTGVLRQTVGEHLSKHRLVKSRALADNNRGGDGATQVDIVD